MIPIYLDPANVRIALIGRGALAARRLVWLHAAGAAPEVWSDAASDDLAALAGAGLVTRLPQAREIAGYHAIWIADLSAEEAQTLAQAARSAGVLVNVEDVVASCDFHSPAIVRRGRLTLAAGTGGASPAVARAARERLEAAFPPSWENALDDIAHARAALRRDDVGGEALVADARKRLAYYGLV